MKSKSEKIIFYLGVAIFLIAKLYLIIPVTLSIESLRTGDDAMTYLWKGHLMLSEQLQKTQTLRDIDMQLNLSKNKDQNLDLIRSEVARRTITNITPTYSLLMGAALKISPNMISAFALTEIVILLFMTIGIAWFFFEITGPAIAGVALLPMAFAILPNQGINVYIPSTLAFSCFLILWAYLWRQADKVKFLLIGIYVFLILGIHPISKIYLILTPFLFWIRLKNFKKNFISALLIRLGLSLSIPLLLVTHISKIFPSLKIPASIIMGNINFFQGISYNFYAAINFLNKSFLFHNILWVFLITGGIFLAPKTSFKYPLNWIILGLVIALFFSLFFMLPGYPAELFTRIWVLMFMMGSLIGARFIYASINKYITYFKILVTGILFTISLAWWAIKYVPDSMNQRNETLNESIIRKNLLVIPLNTTILFAEQYISLQYSLLLGAERYGALVYPMLKGTDNLTRLINERKPKIIIVPSDPNLNSVSIFRAKKFIKRKQGLNFEYIKEFDIQRQRGTTLKKVFLHFENIEKIDINLNWQALSKNKIILDQGVKKISFGYTKFELPEETETLKIVTPDSHFWLDGISSNKHSNLSWPWLEKWSVTYKMRNKENQNITVNFTTSHLLEKFDAAELNKYVDKKNPLISDKGGLVFLRTKYNSYIN
jgi:hypothetical protein